MVLLIQMGVQAVASNKIYINETIACLMLMSAGVQALLGHKSMALLDTLRLILWLAFCATSNQ